MIFGPVVSIILLPFMKIERRTIFLQLKLYLYQVYITILIVVIFEYIQLFNDAKEGKKVYP